MAIKPVPYFVYELVDPRNGWIFYVGKGSGNRPAQHTTEAMAGKRTEKCNVIRDILAAGQKVAIVIVQRFTTDGAAYRFEKRLIAEYGLENLTNIAPGGGGLVVLGGRKRDPDFDWVEIIGIFARNTSWFQRNYFTFFNGEKMPFEQDFKAALLHKMWSLVSARGMAWAAKKFARHSITIAVQNNTSFKVPA